MFPDAVNNVDQRLPAVDTRTGDGGF